jgi:Delta7-sterol 5-desaturase
MLGGMEFDQIPVALLVLYVTATLVATTLFSLALGFAVERRAWANGRRVFDVPLKRGQLRHEAIGTALFHVVFIPPFVLALHSGAIRFSDGWLAQVLGFAVAWYGFVFFYYFMHRAMHHKRLFWMHRWHHASLVTTPMSGLSMHPVEAIGWVVGMLGPAIVLSSFGLLGAWGWGFFLAVHWIGNIVGHSNAELSPVRSTWMSSLLMTNPISYHSLHHARFDGHYGFVVAAMDRAFGTEWNDWLAVHHSVMDGKPLTSLREKLPAPPVV